LSCQLDKSESQGLKVVAVKLLRCWENQWAKLLAGSPFFYKSGFFPGFFLSSEFLT